MTKFQAAKYLEIHEQTLESWYDRNLIHGHKMVSEGGQVRWYFDPVELARVKASIHTCQCGRERVPMSGQLALV